MGFLRSLFKQTPSATEGEITYVSGPSGMVTTTDKQALTSMSVAGSFRPKDRSYGSSGSKA
jgi:hypothetical protein